MSKVEKDFEELLQLFNKHGVRYCIVGAFAVAFHARPRYTKDIDILVEPSEENATRVLDALREFGFGSLELNFGDFSKEGKVVQLGFEPVRIDLITSVNGDKFDDIWKRKDRGKLGATPANFIGLADLIRSKMGTGRDHDSGDLDILKEASKRKKRAKRPTKKQKG